METVYTATTIGAMFLLLKFAPTLKCGPLSYLGRISYPLYLLHEHIGVTLISILKRRQLTDSASILITVAACLCMAIIVHYTVEDPAKDFIVFLWKKRSFGRLVLNETVAE